MREAMEHLQNALVRLFESQRPTGDDYGIEAELVAAHRAIQALPANEVSAAKPQQESPQPLGNTPVTEPQAHAGGREPGNLDGSGKGGANA